VFGLTGENGSTGVRATSLAAQQSQQALREILAQGETGITVRSIRDRFPTQAGSGPKDLTDLRSWNEGQKDSCMGLFDNFVPKLKELLVGLASPRLGVVSRDQNFASVWNRRLPSSSTSLPAVQIAVAGGKVFAGSNGYVYQIDPPSGKIVRSLLVTDELGVGDYTTRLATDGTNLYAGVHGYVYGISLDGAWKQPLWNSGVGGVGAFKPVSVSVGAGRVFAGSNGYAYEFDPGSGKVLNSLLLTLPVGTGGDYSTAIVTDGWNLFAGVHGYASKLLVNNSQLDCTLYHDWLDGNGSWHGWEANYNGAPSGVQSVTMATGPDGNLEVFITATP